MEILTSTQMKAADQYTINTLGVPGEVLMENAAFSIFRLLAQRIKKTKKIAILCGPGNNGGDGYALARHFFRHGFQVYVFESGPKTKEARCFQQIARNCSIPLFPLQKFLTESFDIVIEAIFGIGQTRDLEGVFLQAVEKGNQCSFRISVDVPAGVCSDSGRILKKSFHANLCYTIQNPKPCFFLKPAGQFCEQFEIVDAGIISEPGAIKNFELILEDEIVILPERNQKSHKNDFGHLFCFGGQAGMAGAISFCGRSAFMSGTGLVTLFVSASCMNIVQNLCPHLMCKTWEDTENLNQANVLLAGPGAGTSKDFCKVLEKILCINKPLVLDADALNLISTHSSMQESLAKRKIPAVLTPHPGEFARLCHLNPKEVYPLLPELLRKFCQEHHGFVVFKDFATWICDPNGNLMVFHKPQPALAKGGSGDILSGLIASFLSQKMSPQDACKNAVLLHNRAAQRFCLENSSLCLSPETLTSAICEEIHAIQRQM